MVVDFSVAFDLLLPFRNVSALLVSISEPLVSLLFCSTDYPVSSFNGYVSQIPLLGHIL